MMSARTRDAREIEDVLVSGLGKGPVAAAALADLYEERGEGERLSWLAGWPRQPGDAAADAVRAVDWSAAAAALSRANGRRTRGTLTTRDLLAACWAAWLRLAPTALHPLREAGVEVHGCDCELDWKVEQAERASAGWVSAGVTARTSRVCLALAVRVGDRVAVDVAAVEVSPGRYPGGLDGGLPPWKGWEAELTSPRSVIRGEGHDAAPRRRWWRRLRRWADRRRAA